MELEKIILYILYKLKNIRPTIGRTRIVKLLYLSDLISSARAGEKITKVKYQYYFYGPYSNDIIETLDKLVHEKVVRDYAFPTNSGIAHDYRLSDEMWEKVNKDPPEIDKKQKEIIDEVIKKYGAIRLDKLLDIVYSTRPMKEHAPGDALL